MLLVLGDHARADALPDPERLPHYRPARLEPERAAPSVGMEQLRLDPHLRRVLAGGPEQRDHRGGATALAVVLGSMAAFALSRYVFRGRDGLFLLFTAGLLFPLNTAALPLFLLLQKIGMNDNLFGVALPEAAFSLPVTIVILRPFMRAIPGELEDAATVGGASRIRFFVRILLPLSRPALITVGILAFVTSWNTYLLPLIVLSTPSHFTLPLAVAMFQSQYSMDTARVFAYTAVSMLPALSIFVFAQRYLVGGLVGAIRAERTSR
jgi:raffinose/stachyose/melibiose transport system permease protein